MSWWSATNVSVTTGNNLVTVISGDGIATLSPTDALIIGGYTPVEIDAVYFNGSNNIIRLKRNWTNPSQSNQVAFAFPTDADLGEIAKALNNYLTNFQVATQAEMEAGTDNTHTATALGVKKAIDAQVGTAARLNVTTNNRDTTANRVMKVGDFGLGGRGIIIADANSLNITGIYTTGSTWAGSVYPSVDGSNQGYLSHFDWGGEYCLQHFTDVNGAFGVWERRKNNGIWTNWRQSSPQSYGIGAMLDLRVSVTGIYASKLSTPEVCRGKGTIFGFIGSAEIGLDANNRYGVLMSHGHYTDASGSAGSAYQIFNDHTGSYYRCQDGNTNNWTAWNKQLARGDHGFGTQLAGIVAVFTALTPAQIVANVGNNLHYNGNIQNHGASAPQPWGILSGYITDGNNYSYSYQEFTGINGTKWRRTAINGSTWMPFTKVLEAGDFGIGNQGARTTTLETTHSPSGVYRQDSLGSGIAYSPTLAMNSFDGMGLLTIDRMGGRMAFRGGYSTTGEGAVTWGGPWREVVREGNRGVPADANMLVTACPIGAVGWDLNTITEAGHFKSAIILNSSSNGPPMGVGATGYVFLEVKNLNAIQIQQIATEYIYTPAAGFTPTPSYTWERIRSNGNWSAWQQATAPAVGTVGFNGISVGAIIERGSNANGEFVKFADGTVFAWGTFEQSGLSINPAKSGFNETAVLVDPALPVSMINPVVTPGACEFRTAGGQVVHTIQGSDLQGRSTFLNLGTGPMFTWPRLDTIGSLVITNATIRWSAVGRWR